MVERVDKVEGRKAEAARRGFDLGQMNSHWGEVWVARWCHNCYRGEKSVVF